MSLSTYSKFGQVSLILVVTLALCGCGGSGGSGKVTGRVTYQGRALKGGRVIFEDAKGHVAMAEIDKNGDYTAENVPLGEVKIKVETSYLKKRASQPSYSPPAGDNGSYRPPSPEGALERYVAIPRKYESFESTDLTHVVKRGKNERPIVLEGVVTMEEGGSGSAGGGFGSSRP